MKNILLVVLTSIFAIGIWSTPLSVDATTKTKFSVQKKIVKKTIAKKRTVKKKIVRRVLRRVPPDSKPPVELRVYKFPENKIYGFTYPGNFGVSVDPKKIHELQVIDAFTKKSLTIIHRAGPSDGTLAEAIKKYVNSTYKNMKRKELPLVYTKNEEGAMEFYLEGKKEIHSVFFMGNILIDVSTKQSDQTFLKQFKSIVQSIGVLK